MAETPKQVRLDPERFPRGAAWVRPLVDAFNQLSLQVTQALTSRADPYRVLEVVTEATPADAFPIDVPVGRIVTEARVAMVLAGAPAGAVTVVASMLSGGKLLRVSNITGLAANTRYSIRLALE